MAVNNQLIIPLVIGFILDLMIGDPYKLPHPIRWFGNAISFFEQHLNTGKQKTTKGFAMVLFLVLAVYFLALFMVNIASANHWTYNIVASILVFYGLANKSLMLEALKVEKALNNYGLEAGRKQVSYIVGRDTSQLSEQQIRTAVLETLSENLSDGVIAPLFFYALGGIPLMFAYKMINTLDSMVGYKSERYKQFGFFAAKLDDVANYLPARITAFLMVLVTFSRKGFRYVFKYGNQHASPNSGYPEAALAGILDCRFGGPNRYHGKMVDKPFIGENNREIRSIDIKKACRVNVVTSFVFLLIVLSSFLIH